MSPWEMGDTDIQTTAVDTLVLALGFQQGIQHDPWIQIHTNLHLRYSLTVPGSKLLSSQMGFCFITSTGTNIYLGVSEVTCCV